MPPIVWHRTYQASRCCYKDTYGYFPKAFMNMTVGVIALARIAGSGLKLSDKRHASVCALSYRPPHSKKDNGWHVHLLQ
jgi:hypothetical protein